jgi:quinol monooxygenase YgiN
VIFIVVKLTTKPEHAERFPDAVADYTAATRKEPGNLWFEWSRSLEDPAAYFLVEAFRDDAGAAHLSSPHFREFIGTLPAMLASPPKIINQTIDVNDWSLMGAVGVMSE